MQYLFIIYTPFLLFYPLLQLNYVSSLVMHGQILDKFPFNLIILSDALRHKLLRKITFLPPTFTENAMTSPRAPFSAPTPSVSSDFPLSIHGRFNRLSMIGWFFFLHIIMFFMSLALSLTQGIFNLNTLRFGVENFQHVSHIFTLGSLILVLIYLYSVFTFMVRRLHDLNKTGWLSVLFLLPIFNFFLVLYLMLFPGNRHVNQYGEARKSALWEQILAWIMLIFVGLSLASIISLVSFYMGTGDLASPSEILRHDAKYF